MALASTSFSGRPASERASLMALPPPPDAEGELLGQVMTGKISRNEHRTAMAVLAQSDARTHPLRVPAE
ncbi:hypothetical protein [Actinoplanes sp. GCM10030250]|uniref:hypothetical protein n=1 Tax=Actinoplanes sp. GCM10030250 TaxID=3273376 RepID=UPI00361259AA